ncbi:MAG: (Fe-S)-binding protein [Alistipes sp.]|nr:(Fe-S)-binding protein [Alistipes sp.]
MFYSHFCIPFIVGTVILFVTILYRYVMWIADLPKSDKRLIVKGLFTTATLRSIWETIRESLLHVSIFKRNALLGYMHCSLAFGWFLLIVVGWIETTAYMGAEFVPLQGHVFFRYFAIGIDNHIVTFDHIMDALLLFVLSGVALAWFKRLKSKHLGMRKTTKHTIGDRIALSFLWFIFPTRLVAESITAAVYGGGGFVTANIGAALNNILPASLLTGAFEPIWWIYSCALGGFFIAMPHSRYMHIFTEVPLIFLRNYRLRVRQSQSSYDNFQVQACSRCGICIDACQLQSQLGHNNVQSVYFLRDRRANSLNMNVASDCLMCGRCADRCPVGIDLNSLRLNSRAAMRNMPNERRYNYFNALDRSTGEGKVGYFAGCMTMLTPHTLTAMQTIFTAAGEDVWWADRDGGVCCGRPLRLTGETDSANKMVQYNTALFRKHGITTLVTSCPICLKTFREDYNLEGIEILHHSQYILRLINSGKISLQHSDNKTFTYHDPCELGRGNGIYDEPRSVITAIGTLIEPKHHHRDSLCCGSSLANTVISDSEQITISSSLTLELEATGAKTLVTACPLCKKALGRTTQQKIVDLSEIVATNLNTKP